MEEEYQPLKAQLVIIDDLIVCILLKTQYTGRDFDLYIKENILSSPFFRILPKQEYIAVISFHNDLVRNWTLITDFFSDTNINSLFQSH